MIGLPGRGCDRNAAHGDGTLKGRRSSKYDAAGTTSIDRSGAVSTPPTIGEALRRMICEPVPTVANDNVPGGHALTSRKKRARRSTAARGGSNGQHWHYARGDATLRGVGC